MADVFLGSVYANLELRNVDGLSSQINKATGSMGNFRDTALGVFGGNLLTQGFNQLIAGVSLFAKTGIQGAADLESGMNLLQKVTSATGDEMKRFSSLAIQLGNDITLPGVSASDAADAMIELGKAGLSVNDVMKASKGVLQAATAGQISVADAAKLVSGSLQAFQLDGSKATQVADLMAAAANASALDLDQVGFALNQAGAQASIAGLSIQETVGIIAQMSNAGIRAQQAGTSLSYMLRQLMSPTKKAKDVMAELGLKIYDNEGKFIGIRETIKRLNETTKGLTQEQKAQALSALFGAEAVKAANVVMEQGVGAFDKMQASISKTGAAQELAGARMKGLNGAIEAFKNAFETTAVTIGQIFLPALTEIVKFVTSNIQPILAGLGAVLVGLAGYFLATGGAAAIAGAAMAVALSPITAIVLAAAALGAGLTILEQKFGVVSATIKTITDVLSGLWNAIQVVATGDFKGGIFGLEEDSPVVGALLTLHDVLSAVADFVKGQLVSAWESMVQVFNNAVKALQPFIAPLVEFYQKHAPVINKVLIGIGIALAVLLTPIGAIIAGFAALVAVITVVSVVINVVAKVLEFLSNVFITVRDAIVGFATGVATAFGGAMQGVSDTTNSVGTTIANVWNGIMGFFTTVFATIAAIYNATLKPVFDGIIYVVTAIGTVVFTIFSGIAQIIATVVGTIVQIIGVVLYGSFLWLWNNILVPTGKLFASIFNGIRTVVTNVLNAVGGVIRSVWNAVWAFLKPILTAIGNTISSVFNGIKNVVTSIMNGVRSVISSVWNGISSFISGIVNGIKGAVSSGFNAVKNSIIKPIQDALGKVKGFVGDFLNAGKNIIDGIVNGVSNGKDAVVNKIKDICSGALDAVKNFFGIKSPSKVMAKMFGYVTQGAEVGLENGKNSLFKTFDSVFNQLPSVDLTPAFSGANISGAYARGMNVEAGKGAGNSETNIYGDIHIDKDVDQFNLVEQMNRGAVLARKGMTTDV